MFNLLRTPPPPLWALLIIYVLRPYLLLPTPLPTAPRHPPPPPTSPSLTTPIPSSSYDFNKNWVPGEREAQLT